MCVCVRARACVCACVRACVASGQSINKTMYYLGSMFREYPG